MQRLQMMRVAARAAWFRREMRMLAGRTRCAQKLILAQSTLIKPGKFAPRSKGWGKLKRGEMRGVKGVRKRRFHGINNPERNKMRRDSGCSAPSRRAATAGLSRHITCV